MRQRLILAANCRLDNNNTRKTVRDNADADKNDTVGDLQAEQIERSVRRTAMMQPYSGIRIHTLNTVFLILNTIIASSK